MPIQSLLMLFGCDTWSIGRKKAGRQKLMGEYSYLFYNNASELEFSYWAEASHSTPLFLRMPYLSLLEQIKSDNISMRYVVILKGETPVMWVYFQIIDFTVDVFGSMIAEQFELLKKSKGKLFESYFKSKKDAVLMRLVTSGNNFVSGEYGFHAVEGMDRKEVFRLLGAINEEIGRREKLRGKISATLVKDFYAAQLPDSTDPVGEKYFSFSVEPNMIVDLPEANDVLSYISFFSKKYRNRAKSIFKASENIEVRELTAEEILQFKAEIFALYMQVFNHAKFKLVCLREDYFHEMKLRFPEEFKLFAFFYKGKMLSFCSCLIPGEGNTLYGHYLGFDYENNKEYELYQNMLYKFIDVALKEKKSQVNLGRTASEIKSTVGAKAHDLTCYIKPQNTVSKLILKPFISYLQPTQWIPRNPFKEE